MESNVKQKRKKEKRKGQDMHTSKLVINSGVINISKKFFKKPFLWYRIQHIVQ